jgi:hypothetical protein
MNYPDFFTTIEAIKVQDPLSQVLGAFSDGAYEFSYLDVVKSAGHSCPTVAGAYLMTLEALKALYADQRAVRGDIKVEFKESLEEGVAGVIGNVISQITGATETSGFKGLNGKFARHSLMDFNANINASARFTRLSNNTSVDVLYNPNTVPADSKMMPLMQKMLQGQASKEETQEFGKLWQKRVENIFANIPKVITLTLNQESK